MPILLAIFPYLIGGIVMWFVAHHMGASGRDVSLFRAAVAVFLMALCGAASQMLTRPLIGDWRYLVDFVICVLVAMSILQLTFWRSFAAVVVYSVVMIGLSVVLAQTIRL